MFSSFKFSNSEDWVQRPRLHWEIDPTGYETCLSTSCLVVLSSQVLNYLTFLLTIVEIYDLPPLHFGVFHSYLKTLKLHFKAIILPTPPPLAHLFFLVEWLQSYCIDMFLIVLFIKILALQIFVMFYQWDKALLPSENCFRLAVIGWMAWRSFWKSLAERSWESGVKAPKGRALPFLHLGSWEMYFAALPPPTPPPTAQLSPEMRGCCSCSPGLMGSVVLELCVVRGSSAPGKRSRHHFFRSRRWVNPAPPRPLRGFLAWAWY